MGVFYTFEGMKFIGLNATETLDLYTFSATATSGSSTLTAVSSLQAIVPGAPVESVVLPPNTYVLSVDQSANTVTLSAPATASSGGTPSTFAINNTASLNLPVYVHLAQGALSLTADMTVANLTEANYDGYQPQLAQGPVVIRSAQNRAYVQWEYDRLTFQPTDYTVTNTVTGHYWTYTPPGSTSPVLIAVESWPNSLALLQDGDNVTINPTLTFAYDQTAGPSSPGVAA